MKLPRMLTAGALSAWAVIAAECGWGQEMPAASVEASAPTADAANAAQGDTAPQIGIADIVVTAQRRSQNQQDVPISVTALSGEAATASGPSNTEALTAQVPSLQFSRQASNGGTPFVRGIGSPESVPGAEGAVAVYVDDVYVSYGAATLFDLSNIDSIEVLKGPQGTLFGRNATGGVVHVHTRQPSHQASADAQFGYASYDTINGSLYATGGLSETVAVNLAVSVRDQRDGYGRNLLSGGDVFKERSRSVRGKLLFQPTSGTELTLTGYHNDLRSDLGLNRVILPGTVGTGGGTFVDRFGTFNTPSDYATTNTWGASGKLVQDVADLKVVSITSYRKTRFASYIDLDGSPIGQVILGAISLTKDTAFTQEVQIQSPQSETFNWIVGGFYYDGFGGYNPNRNSGTSQAASGGFRDLSSAQTLHSVSAFADGTWQFLPGARLTLGARYTSDRYRYDRRLATASGAVTNYPRQRSTFSKPTWRAILDYRFSPQAMVYGSYSRGFKSGRYNIGTGGVVAPESLDAYELGIKTDLFDRRVRFNAAAFHYDYTNIQVTSVVGGILESKNAASARVNGLDTDVTFAPTGALTLTAGLSLLDAKYTDFLNGTILVPNPATCTPTPATTGPLTAGYRNCPANLSGNRLIQAPKSTINVTANYRIESEVGEFALNASLYHNPGYFWEQDNVVRSPGYNLVNASVGWQSPGKGYEIRVYGRNLLNEYYWSAYSTSTSRASYTPAMPDNYGVIVTAHF